VMRRMLRSRVGIVLGLAALSGGARADEPRLAEYFGFRPLEIYKLDPRIGNLLIKDLDGDKVEDVAIVNNGRSRIDLLLSTKRPADEERRSRTEANQVPSDRRMRLKSLPVNKEVASLQAGDFNGDGRPDLAYYGTPAELIILYNQGQGNFGNPKRVSIGEAVEKGAALAVGDLNRDGRDDLALLAPGEVVTILQEEGGRLGEPERLPHTATNPWLLRAVDLDGDGGQDLVIVDAAPTDPIRVRFSVEGGKLGPELRFATETPRAVAFSDLDGKKGSEILAIEGQSGRVKVLTLDEGTEDESEVRGRLVVFPLPKGDLRGRSLDVGDLDGDKKPDVVVTDPANAQFLVYRQGKTGLEAAQTFPGLVGGKTVRLADLDGDGKAEVVVLSEAEKQVGLSRLSDSRLTFPTPLPISGGEPVALEVADLDDDKAPEVLYVTRGGEDAYELRGLKRDKSGAFVPFRWGPEDAVKIKGLSGSPPALRVLDVNRDGEADILVFNAYGSPILLLGRPGGEPPAPAGGSLGQLAGASPAGISLRTPGGPGLIVAQKTYARSIALDRKSGQWEIKDQYNSGRTSAQVIGAAAIDTDGDGTAEVALLDRTSKSLLFLAKKQGVYRPSGTLSVGAMDFLGMHVADFDGDGRDDLLLAGADKFGVVLTGRKGLRLKALAGYESARKDAGLADLIAGDLNGDGRPDVAITDTSEHFLEICTFTRESELDRAIAFKIFEQKSFHDRGAHVEPRDMAVGDVDGDGRTDLVLIVHDRVLIYRQDPGSEKEKEKTAATR
jgi:hypothetical protein